MEKERAMEVTLECLRDTMKRIWRPDMSWDR